MPEIPRATHNAEKLTWLVFFGVSTQHTSASYDAASVAVLAIAHLSVPPHNVYRPSMSKKGNPGGSCGKTLPFWADR